MPPPVNTLVIFRNPSPVIVKEKYFNDTLLLSDYVYCGGFYRISLSLLDQKGANRLDGSVDFDELVCPDSIFSVFRTALNKLGLPIQVAATPIRHCDSIFAHNSKASTRELHANRAVDLLEETQGKTMIVPIIYFESIYKNEASGNIFRGEALGFGSYYNKFTDIIIKILIIKDAEILYSRTSLFSAEIFDSYDKYDPCITPRTAPLG